MLAAHETSLAEQNQQELNWLDLGGEDGQEKGVGRKTFWTSTHFHCVKKSNLPQSGELDVQTKTVTPSPFPVFTGSCIQMTHCTEMKF